MKINRQEFVASLEVVKPGLAKRELVEQSTSFAFMGDRIVTYNDEVSISHPIKGLNVEGAVKASELYELLSRLIADEVDIEVRGSEILLSAGRSKAGLTLQSEIKLPLDEVGSFEKWIKLPPDFKDALAFARFSCASDLSRPVLTCLHVAPDRVESLDNFRITRWFFLKKSSMKEAFLLPVSSVESLTACEISEMAVSEGWVHFRSGKGGTVFSCRKFAGEFPDIAPVFEVEGEKVKFPKTLDKILDRALVFAKKDQRTEELVSLTFEDRFLKVRSEGESGWFEETVNMRHKGGGMVVFINPSMLKDMFQREMIHCVLGDRSVKFEGERWEHVIAIATGDGVKQRA